MRLKEQLALLIELQKMESTAGGITARKKDLPVQMADLETKFKEYHADVEAERAQLEELRKRRRDKDNQLRLGQETLKRTRDRLLDVKTNKEYQSVLKEIETFETKNSQMEDEIISLLDELDLLEKAVKTREEELEAQSRGYEEEKIKMTEELSSLVGELEICVRKSGELKKNISADILRKYEQIKNAGRGIAVVSCWKEICSGCHMFIPPQLYNELQKSVALVTCPNCSRIIYWENKKG
jgi:predicted  nucleic acid-binding Zn-ribbon protein